MRARQEVMFVKNPTLNEAMRITAGQDSHPNRWVTYVWERGNKVIYDVRRPSAEKNGHPNYLPPLPLEVSEIIIHESPKG